MATPVPDSYSVASGAVIYGGRAAPSLLLSGDWLIGGDSITDPGYPSNAFVQALGLTRKPSLRLLKNTAVYGRTIQNVLDNLQTEVLAHSPAVYSCRIGTNSDALGASVFEAQYNLLIDRILAAGIFMFVHAIPPKGYSSNAYIIARNATLKARCDADPLRLKFVDDCKRIAIGDYTADPDYYQKLPSVDAIHPAPIGGARMAEDIAAVYAPMLASASGVLATDATDVYPTNPASKQLIRNPFFTGTGGTLSAATGAAPDGWAVSTTGGAGTAMHSTIVAADVGDTNTRPWLSMALNGSSGSGQGAKISQTLQNPAFAAGPSLLRLDTGLELRFVGLNTAYISTIEINTQDLYGGQDVSEEFMFLHDSGVLSKTFTLRHAPTRNTAVPIQANGLRFFVNVNFSTAFAAFIGRVDVRCPATRWSDN